MTTELEPLWSEQHIYKRLLQDAFTYRELGGGDKINAILLIHAKRAMGNMQGYYLKSLATRENCWASLVADRDRKIAELQVQCDLYKQQLEQLRNEPPQEPTTDEA